MRAGTGRRARALPLALSLAIPLTGALAACSDDDGGAASTSSTTSPPSTVVEGPVAPTELVVGDCINGVVIGTRQQAELTTVDLVSCARPHSLEVFETVAFALDDFESTEDGQFPGRARVVRVADERCLSIADDAGIDREVYGLIAFWPTQASWGQGDREVACAIFATDGSSFDERQLG